ncbi:hypothetical protein DRO60_01170 [Candidatus Bathyarchaeota archaeon]|nr:MAG: hypothetical protein DRO60_01170 [Candidatus Bathyarchaeota archaeon]
MAGAGKEAYEKLLEALSEREELTTEDLMELSGLGKAELEAAVSTLEALGVVEREEGIIRWLGHQVRGRIVIIKGKVDYVIHNPFEVRVFGLEELRAMAKS